MKKGKMQLSELKVKSFVTDLNNVEQNEIKGASGLLCNVSDIICNTGNLRCPIGASTGANICTVQSC
ncbi:MAG: pinensin family lanthipeptide [Bacteroidota bacterium]